MPRVAIIGAGETGAAIARALVEREIAREVRLIDPSGAPAAGKALDILQSAPIARSDTKVSSGQDAGAALDADIVVIADLHGGAAWEADRLTEIAGRVAAASAAPIVFALPEHRQVVEHAARMGIASGRLIGSAPDALASCARALVAAATGVSPSEIDVPVAGAPGAWVLAWSQASVAGSNAAAALPAHAILRLGDQIRASWPPGPHALGSAGARVVRVMTSGLPRRATVFAVVEQPGDVRRVAAAAPAYLNEQGIVRVQWPAMSERERVELDTVLAGLLQTS